MARWVAREGNAIARDLSMSSVMWVIADPCINGSRRLVPSIQNVGKPSAINRRMYVHTKQMLVQKRFATTPEPNG